MFSEKNSKALLVVLLFSLTIFFFAPLHIYFTNRFEFPFVFSLVVPYFISVTLISIILIMALLFILPGKIRDNAVLIIFILSFLTWFQGNILVWNYGVFDGNGIDWGKNYFRGIIDTGIWLSCFIIGLRKSGFIFKILRRAGIWLILIQLGSLIFVMVPASELPSTAKYDTKINTLFNFSKKKNIVILVIDAFQSDIFQEIIDEDKTYEDIFRGFTYFPNAVGGFPHTYPSVPLILTGSFYDNSIETQEFIKREFLSRSLPKFLKDNGFRVEIYPFPAPHAVYCDPLIASNLEPKKNRCEIGEQIAFIYDDQRWFLRKIVFRKTDKNRGLFNFTYISPSELSSRHSATRFFKELVSCGAVSINQGVFKYIHLLGMHPPLLINEQLQNELLPYNRQNYKRQAKGFLKLLSLFLGKLNDMGVYDNSMVLILGDHGGGRRCLFT